MSYIVFPGNVGSNESLSHVAEKLGVPMKCDKQIHQNSAARLRSSEIARLRAANQTFQLLNSAKTKSNAIAAFNVYNLEGAKAAVDAAQELQSPVILQVTTWHAISDSRPYRYIHLLSPSVERNSFYFSLHIVKPLPSLCRFILITSLMKNTS